MTRAARAMAVSPDAWLVSYPKCGRTWLRLLLGRVFQSHFVLPAEADLLEIEALAQRHPRLPRVRVTHDDKPQWKHPDAIEQSKSAYAPRRVILLVRDPRDVVVSSYHQKVRRRHKYRGTLASFLREPVGGFDGILRFYNAWAKSRHIPRELLLMRYEALHAATGDELARVLDFLGVDGVSKAVLDEAVAFAAFDHMRELERRDHFGSARLRPGDPADPDSFKVRRGVVGGFRDELSPEDCELLSTTLRQELAPWYGYR